MGVKGLWKVLRPAASTESVTRLAMDGFNRNIDNTRGYRVGIDASVWFGHVEKTKNKNKLGKNAALRTLFFRCTHLLEVPLLPLFVFDGNQRPLVKRGKAVQLKDSRLLAGMKELLDAFGFQWHEAPGEAEAELAYLNNIGIIDAVWTDDGDVFLFGAETVIRSPSSTLSSNTADPILNQEGNDDGKHVAVLRASEIESHSDVQLSRGGLILIALLRVGDYDKGVPQIGMQIAHGLARCGFGDSLLHGVQTRTGQELRTFLASWRRDIISELRSNAQGFLGRKQAKLAQSFPNDFPKLAIVAAYTDPVISDQKETFPQLDWTRKLDISALAEVCGRKFGWSEDELLKRFKSLIWPAAVIRVLRDAVLSIDCAPGPQNTVPNAPVHSSVPMTGEGTLLVQSLLVGFHGQREHASTDFLLEIRTEIDPACFVRAARNGLSSLHPQPPVHPPARSTGSIIAEDQATVRVWLPVCMVQLAAPQLAGAPELRRTKRRPMKRRRDTESMADSDASSTGVKHGSQKTMRTSAGRVLPRDRDGNLSKRTHTPVIDLASASDSDVTVISDSDDARDIVDKPARVPGVIIDLT